MLAWFRCRRRRRGSPAACLGDCGGGPFLGGAAKGPQEHFVLDPDFDVAAAELICIYECDWAPQLRDAQVGRAASAEAVAAHHFIAPSVSGDIIGNDPDEEEGRSWPATAGANIFVTLDPIVTMPTEAVVVAKPRTPSEGARRCAPGGASRSRGAHAGIAIPRSSLRLGLRRPRFRAACVRGSRGRAFGRRRQSAHRTPLPSAPTRISATSWSPSISRRRRWCRTGPGVGAESF